MAAVNLEAQQMAQYQVPDPIIKLEEKLVISVGSDLDDADEAAVANAAAQDSPSGRAMAEVTLKWLLLLTFVTLLMLVFQVAAGCLSGSLTLLADSAHSSIDVITYGLNYFVERLKVRSTCCCIAIAQGRDKSSLATKVDIFGGAISVVALLLAECYAVTEAIERLSHLRGTSSHHHHHEHSAPAPPPHIHPPTADLSMDAHIHRRLHGGGHHQDDDFSNLGLVLLIFSVVSTLANLGILMTYLRWQGAAQLSVDENDTEMVSSAVFAMPMPPNPAAPPPPPPTDAGSSRPLRASVLRLPVPSADNPLPSVAPPVPSDSLSVPPMPPIPVGAPQRRLSARQLARGRTKAAAPRFGKEFSSLQRRSMLHMLVHPGCTDASHVPQGSMSVLRASSFNSQGGDIKASPSSPAQENNLNLSGAMLHLAADVVRGFTILICSIIIQAGVVSDVGRADAICSLLVAILILIGSAAIFQRLVKALRDSCGNGLQGQGP